MRLLACALVAMGCSGMQGPAVARQGFTVTEQSCSYDLSLPAELAGSLPTYADAGVDCVPPEGGDEFTIGFGWHGGVLRLVAPRPVSGVVPLSAVGLYVRTAEGWCVEWEGEAVIDELPEWSVFIDGKCLDNGLRVVGQISGK